MEFEKLAWTDIEKKQKETRTVIVPLSPLEEHGPHLPVSTDYIRAYEVSKRAAEKAGVFCLPPIILGTLSKMYAYPGSVSVSGETLQMVVQDICRSLKDTGFERIIIISGHGGTKHPAAILAALDKLDDKNISFATVGHLVEDDLKNTIIKTEGDSHAGEKETSDMLYLSPKEVSMKKALRSFPTYPKGDVPKTEYRKANPTGVWGDATKASRAKGKKMMDSAVANLVKMIESR